MGLTNELNEDVKKLNQEIAYIKNELNMLRGGRLYSRHRNGNYYYTEITRNSHRGITSNKSLVHILARKGFLHEQLKIRKRELELLNSFQATIERQNLNARLDSYIAKFPELDSYKIYTPYDKVQWEESTYSSNPYNPDELKYKTSSGVFMRSKSERHIGNFLEAHNVSYRYEALLEIGGYHYYPDFTVRRPDGKTVIWEHLGLAGVPDYDHRTFVKLNAYRDHGYCHHTNLICTYEKDIHDTDTLERILEHYVFG